MSCWKIFIITRLTSSYVPLHPSQLNSSACDGLWCLIYVDRVVTSVVFCVSCAEVDHRCCFPYSWQWLCLTYVEVFQTSLVSQDFCQLSPLTCHPLLLQSQSESPLICFLLRQQVQASRSTGPSVSWNKLVILPKGGDSLHCASCRAKYRKQTGWLHSGMDREKFS